ncbi:putative LRR containing protein [Trachipleistophora hominis]|uniref:Putative LRR containing protein n=1 Tax=Trachipleistophora hominis TaxID=72359 RepID=L7JU45_TRAHO|nr:putative LRR containing protein [Trachipleistophora hominis]
MWSNLYGYVEMSLKYIFVFSNEQKTNEENFLIFENPEDAGMTYLLNQHEATKTKLALPYETQKRIYFEKKEVDYETIYDHVHYHSNIAGIRRIIYRTYHDIIRENADVRFEVVHVPFTILLYQKVMKYSQRDVDPNMNTEEVCTLLTHFALFDEYVKESISYIICMHLIKNPKLLHNIRNYRDKPNENQYTPSVRSLSLLIFGNSNVSILFRKVVKSYVEFSLSDNKGNSAQIRKERENNQFYVYNIYPNHFTLEFLFDKLDIEFEWLQNNMNILDEKFDKSVCGSPYSVFIYRKSSTYEPREAIDKLMQDLKMVIASKFITGNNISELTLEFKGIYTGVDLSCLNKIKASIRADCKYCTLDFIRSIPENIKIEMRIAENMSADALNNIPKNVVKISFTSVNFTENMIFPEHIENIIVSKCDSNPNVILTINKMCRNVEISQTRAKPCVSVYY